jgi:hypothetical protein
MKFLFEVSLVTAISINSEDVLAEFLDYALNDILGLAFSLHEGQYVIDVVWDYVSSFSKGVKIYFLFGINSGVASFSSSFGHT